MVAMENSYDIAVIGGGIIGPRAPRAALGERAPRARASSSSRRKPSSPTHQTGKQLGRHPLRHLLQAGSYKAKLCVEGKGLMLEFCQKHGIRVDHVGKVIVATEPAELPRLQTPLRARDRQRRARSEMLDPASSGNRAARQALRASVALDRDRRLQGSVRGDDARAADRPGRRDRDRRGPRDLDQAERRGDRRGDTRTSPYGARRIVNCGRALLRTRVFARMAGRMVDLRIIHVSCGE
jgi:hypothetical protein